MIDKNGIEIKTGMIVEITGAYFKNDNALYFVTNSPGDPSWCGSDHSLKRISKAGKISKAKYSTRLWPIGAFVSDYCKRAEAQRWNKDHAEIEVKSVKDLSEVIAYFQEKADNLRAHIKREVWDFGEDSKTVKKDRAILAHYEAVAAGLREEGPDAQISQESQGR